MSTDTNPIIQPPAALLTTVTNPNTKQTDYAFPLQTDAWLKMQAVVKTAIAFPLLHRYGLPVRTSAPRSG